ncbi:MAG: hypothetical protein HY815_23910 [Candidatus Riflebacteria bacterium]|nr:hypothetical protein [Candidatus Riflebacteria bacterium]
MDVLLVLWLSLISAQTGPPFSAETRSLIQNTPTVGSPLEGYLTIGEFLFRRRRYDRARQVFAYGLLYAPSDVRFLDWLARTELALGRVDMAREYAGAALSIQPGDPTAQDVLGQIRSLPGPPGPSPAATPHPGPEPGPTPSPASPASPSGSASPGHGSPAASPGPSPAPKAPPRELLAMLAPLVGASSPKEIEASWAPSGQLDSKLPGDQLVALGTLKAVEAAIRYYLINHPKAEMKTLDLKVLVEDKVLPKDLDLSGFPEMTLEGGSKVSMAGFGTVERIEEATGAYRSGLDKATRYREKGLLTDCFATLKPMLAEHKGDRELLERFLRVQMDLAMDFEGAETARQLFLVRPSDPKNLFTLALLYYRSGRPDVSRKLANLLPRAYSATFYAPAALALAQLIDTGVSHAVMQKLLAEKEQLFKELGEPSPEPAPAPSASPAATPSPAGSPSPSK